MAGRDILQDGPKTNTQLGSGFRGARHTAELSAFTDITSKNQWRHLRLQLQPQTGGRQPEALNRPAGSHIIVNGFGRPSCKDGKVRGTEQARQQIQFATTDPIDSPAPLSRPYVVDGVRVQDFIFVAMNPYAMRVTTDDQVSDTVPQIWLDETHEVVTDQSRTNVQVSANDPLNIAAFAAS